MKTLDRRPGLVPSTTNGSDNPHYYVSLQNVMWLLQGQGLYGWPHQGFSLADLRMTIMVEITLAFESAAYWESSKMNGVIFPFILLKHERKKADGRLQDFCEDILIEQKSLQKWLKAKIAEEMDDAQLRCLVNILCNIRPLGHNEYSRWEAARLSCRRIMITAKSMIANLVISACPLPGDRPTGQDQILNARSSAFCTGRSGNREAHSPKPPQP